MSHSGLRQRLRATAHGWTDELLTRLMGGPKLYPDGFGRLDEVEALVEEIRGYDAAIDVTPLAVEWAEARPGNGGWVKQGSFRSPAHAMLPPESQRGRVQLHEPKRARSGGPMVLLLAATGEEGFALRSRIVGPLLREGISALLLENPYYGTRRPQGQQFSLLRTVRDQFAMNTSTVEESRALLRWMHDAGHQPGASGYSQGGMMASFAAALSAFPVAAVPRASGRRAAPIFTENALQRRFAWGELAKSFGSEDEARAYFAASLEPVDVGRFPAPQCPEAAILLGSVHDRYIPPAEVHELHAHWPGSELRWRETGHLTGALVGQGAHAQAIIDAFARLPA